MKILIVDDDPGTINALKVGLLSSGHQTITARNGPEALKAIESSVEKSGPVEIMVTDLKMPGMNGLELIRSARQLIPDLPAILMTAYGDNDVRKEVIELGHCRYIEKPFRPDTLLKMIKEIEVSL